MDHTSSVNKVNFSEALHWRYATKKMNGKPVPQEKVERILEAIQLAPSGMGLQPYTVIVVSDPELKKQILPVAYNQQQVVDCSHLLIFAAWTKITEERISGFLELNAKIRNAPTESLDRLRASVDKLNAREPEVNFNWAARQAYIAFGFGIVAAALEQVDATPMEGFNPQAVDELLGLEKQDLKSVALLPLGYRDANDWLAPLTKMRREKEKLFIQK